MRAACILFDTLSCVANVHMCAPHSRLFGLLVMLDVRDVRGGVGGGGPAMVHNWAINVERLFDTPAVQLQTLQ